MIAFLVMAIIDFSKMIRQRVILFDIIFSESNKNEPRKL
jgi:hypothetical protein